MRCGNFYMVQWHESRSQARAFDEVSNAGGN
jgi:hypothetical protein